MAALTVLGASACGSDGGDPEQGPSISPVLDTDREASASIGPDGGSVAATAADGTEYTLAIPAEALIEDTEISLTPILGIDDLPMSGGLVAGVHFEPSGLELFRTATLSVTLPEASSLGSEELLAGFTYDGEGENLALTLADAAGDSFTLPILHFSGAGSGAATPAETRVKPDLQAAVSNDAALERALAGYRRWLTAEGALEQVDVFELVSESHDLAAAALKAAIARANDLCERQGSFVEAENVLLWQRRAESVLPEDALAANGLDRQAVVDELCVQVVFESTSFPAAPALGEPALLEVVVGFAFAEGPTEFSFGMVVNVLTTGATPADAQEFTDQSGRVEVTLTPDSPSVEIEVDACIGIGGFASRLVGESVCQQAFIVRGLVVSPGAITLAPGTSQQFTAELLGITEEVTWAADGGSIDESGLFVAGGSAGTFTVTATSVANPSLTASARVTIDGDIGEPVTTILHGTAQCVDVDDLGAVKPSGIRVMQMGSQLEIHFPRVVPQSTTPYGDSFSGTTNDCSGGPCEISGTFDGSTISGRAVWDNICTSTRCPQGCDCYTDFEATVAPECVDLSDRLACEL
ncbi:MAG: hypothetical protein AMJ63_14465 [Myxococcales bacterium SG8_38_1]|nr:MAG: hypothetical protein AMJ63_14465 [Myxococcales bacterium SG8_38_1]